MDIRVPNLAEGISSGTVVNVLVKQGDSVTKNQTLLELETEKAIAPVPSPADGVIEKILVSVGNSVTVGQVIIALESSGVSQPAIQPAAKTEPVRQAVMPVRAPEASASPVSQPGFRYQSVTGFPPPAAPTVRKLAVELGIDLTHVRGSESGGRITMEDLKRYIQELEERAAACQSAQSRTAAPKPPPASIDFSKFGPVTRKPMSQLRKKISEKMTDSWQSLPQVTQFDEADITDLAELRKRYLQAYEKEGAKLTLTVLLLKAVTQTLKAFPDFNASLDEAAGEIVYKDYCHLGIAVDTEQGLIVPVLKNADQKSIPELCRALQELAEKTKNRKIAIEDLQGGTFTISNQGGIGGGFFTPIINKPESAILGIGQSQEKPVMLSGAVRSRLILPLCLSYDHRLIDGGSAARFITDLRKRLEHFKEEDVKL